MTEPCETEDEFEWKPVRRLASWVRRYKVGVVKDYTKQQKGRRLSIPKYIMVEEDEQFSDAAKQVTVEDDGRSGQEIASMLCGMTHEKLSKVVQHCLMLKRFWQNVPVHAFPAVVQIPSVSCGQRIWTPGREPGAKGKLF